MTQEKLIETVKKLLALAASPNEAEASLAMQKAKDLILKYNLEISESAPAELKIERIEVYCNIRSNGLSDKFPIIVDTIGSLFGTYCLVHTFRGSVFKVELFGFRTNIELAQFAIDSILVQAQLDYIAGYKKLRSIAYTQGFWSGFAAALYKRFKSIKEEQPEGIVLWDKAKQARDEISSGKFNYNLSPTLGVTEGMESAQNVQIRKGIRAETKGNLIA